MASSRAPSAGSERPARGTRREEILNAAAQLFARHGFHGVSIDDIGAAVGISGPGLYRHFSGKTAVLAEMLLGISQHLLDEGNRVVLAAADAPSALDALVRGQIDFALGQPALITVHDRELGNVPEADRRRIRRLQRLYVEEWVTVLSDLYPGNSHARLRAATHATFGLLNSTPHSAAEMETAEMAELLRTMAHATLSSAAAPAQQAPTSHAPSSVPASPDAGRPEVVPEPVQAL
jgi:AcrR family transcriptional regulator